MTAELESIYQKFQTVLSPEDEAALLSIATHEAAHDFIGTRLGIESDAIVVGQTGACVCNRPGSALDAAAIGWAGILGQVLLGVWMDKSWTLPKTKLTSATLAKWVSEFRLYQLTLNDRRAIEGHHSKYESAKLSYTILSENLDTLLFLAERLAARSREKFAECKSRLECFNEWEISRFTQQFKDAETEKLAAKEMRRVNQRAQDILAGLPPVPVPTEFTYQSFKDAVGTGDEEIAAFCFFKVQRERWQVGLGAPSPEAVETALKFFREHGVENEERWIHSAKEFCRWRAGELRSI